MKNTMAHLPVLLATVWLSIYCFTEMNVDLLGYAALGLLFFFLMQTFGAVGDDMDKESPTGMRNSSWGAIAVVLIIIVFAARFPPA